MNASQGSGGIWGADIWSDINRAVAAEAGLVRVVQKVFPTTPMPGALNVPADIVFPEPAKPAPQNSAPTKPDPQNPDPSKPDPQNLDLRIVEGETKRLVEMSVVFRLTQTQAENEATERAGRKLARLAASALALAEDKVLLRGQSIIDPNTNIVGNGRIQVTVADREAAQEPGLVESAANKLDAPNVVGNPLSFVQKVVDGITKLAGLGQPGPYALLLPEEVYGALYQPFAGLSTTADGFKGPDARLEFLATPANSIAPLVTGGFYSTPALDKEGLLASLGGEAVSIYVGVEPQAEFTQTDVNGVLRLRVFERVQFVVRDTEALLRFEFTKKVNVRNAPAQPSAARPHGRRYARAKSAPK